MSSPSVARRRAGFTLVELVLALLLTLLVANLTLRAHSGARRLLGAKLRQVERLQAHRSTRLVLRGELSAGAAGEDWVVYPPDSLHLRAYRGFGRVCATAPDSTFVLEWDGHRRPDPAKDSVLLLRSDGRWVPLDLLHVGATGPLCPGTAFGTTEVWTVSGPTEQVVLARLFEAGSYHVGDGALRYRRGAGGRQPLTTPDLEDAELRLRAGSLSLAVADPSRPDSIRVDFLAETTRR